MKKKSSSSKVVSFPKPARQVDPRTFPASIAVDACFLLKVRSHGTAEPERHALESALVYQEWLRRGGLCIPAVVLAEFSTAGNPIPLDVRLRTLPLNNLAIARIDEVIGRNGPLKSKKVRNDAMIAACASAHGITSILTYDESASHIWKAFEITPRDAESFLAKQTRIWSDE